MFPLDNKDFREFVELLNSRRVRYLIVGGHAVALHGYPRFTGDLDIWVAADPENASRVADVLKEFGFGMLKLEAGDFTRPGYAVQLGRPPYRIDILTSIDAVDFAYAYQRRVVVKSGSMEVAFIALNELIANKRATGRIQDLADVEKLQAAARTTPAHSKSRRRRRG